jgi:hypothetical protein
VTWDGFKRERVLEKKGGEEDETESFFGVCF